MGFLDTVKGWLNIGGVKVQIQDMNQVVPKSGDTITGKAVVTSKSDKHVNKLTYRFVLNKTTGRGAERKTKEFVIAQSVLNQPFDIKAGETKTFDFLINYSLDKSLKDMGGVLGAVGKLGALATGEKSEYLVIAACDVQGAALNPSAKVEVTIGD